MRIELTPQEMRDLYTDRIAGALDLALEEYERRDFDNGTIQFIIDDITIIVRD